ncbi:hypothetical protein D9615_000913 [Tricholomella constricta]|uniref:Transcription termination and cleavage factor C-terminal domain-containing protein n=1 Tax=Tricholomella constricta TaxID=117010 RepID=A0A8H5HKX5_9AGAR|nr:hypothetical protein D9615_000913 [Tricholomella constricta]
MKIEVEVRPSRRGRKKLFVVISMSNQSFAAEQLLELLLQLKKTTPAAARSILNGQPQIAYALMTLMVTMNAVNFDVFQKTLAEYGSNSKPAPPMAPTPPVAATHSSVPPSVHPSASSTPVPALPPHLLLLQQQQQQQHYRTATPPSSQSQSQSQPYPYSNGHAPVQQPQSHSHHTPYGQPSYSAAVAAAAPSTSYGSYTQSQQAAAAYSGYPGYGAPITAPAPSLSAPTPPNTSNPNANVTDALASIPEEQKALIMRVITMTPEQINALPPAERQTYIQLRATLGVPT